MLLAGFGDRMPVPVRGYPARVGVVWLRPAVPIVA